MKKDIDKDVIISVRPDETLMLNHRNMEVDKRYEFKWLNMNCVAYKDRHGKVTIAEVEKVV